MFLACERLATRNPGFSSKGVAHSDRRAHDEDIDIQDLAADARPVMTIAFVGGDAWLDVVIGKLQERRAHA